MVRLFTASSLILLTSVLFAPSAAVAQNNTMLFDDSNQRAPYKVAKAMSRQGDQKKDDTKPLDGDKAKSAKPPQPNVSTKRRKELMEFVKAHHPELQRLLASLNKVNPGGYQTTLRTLDREIKALQTLKTKSPSRYENSLELWTIKSKIRVLTAQLARKQQTKERKKILAQIAALVTKDHDLRTKQVRADYEANLKRTERLKATLDNLEGDRDNLIARTVEKHDRSAQRIIAQNQKAKDAKKKQNDKSKAASNGKSDGKKPADTNKSEDKDKKNDSVEKDNKKTPAQPPKKDK